MDLDSVSDELYAAKREEFTALRDERAKQARPDRQLVDSIAGLRKPTVAAWLVNQVSRAAPEEIERLGSVGESMQVAHQRLAGAELRALSKERHEVIELLTKRAQWLARKAGYTFSDTAQRQVSDTFEAALGDERALEAIRAARLSTALAPGSPETWLTAALLPAKRDSRPRVGPGGAGSAHAEPGSRGRPDAGAGESGNGGTTRRRSGGRARPGGDDARPGRGEAARRKGDGAARRAGGDAARREAEEAARREAEEGARRKADEAAEKARREAEDAAEEARREADEAAHEQESAEQALADAEGALADAEQSAEDAAAVVRDLQARLEDARAAEREARAEVTSARRSVTSARRTAKSAQERATRADDRATKAENRAAEFE